MATSGAENQSLNKLICSYALPEPFRYLVVPSSWFISEKPTATFVKQRPSIIDMGITTVEDYMTRFPGEYIGVKIMKQFLPEDVPLPTKLQWFVGKVTKVSGKQFYVVYEDDDSEWMSFKDLQKFMQYYSEA